MIFNKLLDGINNINKGISKGINKGYEAQSCQLCGIQFSMIKLQRIHRCKRCLRYICSKCGKQKSKILQQNGKWSQDIHRICKKCKNDFDLIHHTVIKYDLKWSNNSRFCQLWIKTIKSKDYDYQHFLKLYYKNQANYQEQSQIIVKDVIKGRTDYTVFNYSMKQFLYTIQQTYDKTQTRNGIARVLYAIAAKFDTIGYCQGMSGIVAFLLCFSSQEGCFQMFCDLLQKVYPPNFFSKSNVGITLMGLLAEISFLQQYFIMILKKRANLINHFRQPYTQSDYDRFRMIIQLSATKCLLALFVSTLSFSNSLFIWQELSKKKSFQVIQRAFLATIYTCRQVILQIKSFQKLEQQFQNIDHQYFVDTYYDLQIDFQLKKQLIDKFYHNLSSKWQDSSDHNVKGLTKATNFTQKQIKFLQSQFCPEKQKVFINCQQFIQIVSLYYQKQKIILHQDDAIFQINQQYLKRIFKSYNSQNNQQGLDFRQFICCLSVCCKGTTKQRLCSIINTFQDKSHSISIQSFQKLIQSLVQLTPIFLKNDSLQFKQRMNNYFKFQEKISINQMYILLNDQFINQLSFFAHKQENNVLEVTIRQYMERKKKKQ